MKKNILIYIIILLIIILLFKNTNTLGEQIINISYIFINSLLPYLLSFFIISKILNNYNLPYYISKLFNNNIYIYLIILSILGGTPNNIILLKDLYSNKTINIEDANKYLSCLFFTNPLFLYNILKKIFSIHITITIILSHYLANIIIYIIKHPHNRNINKNITIGIDKCVSNSIKEFSIIIINIYITIILFNILIIIIPSIFNNFKGLIELTYGLNYIINNPLIYKDILSIIYISFGGLSIIIQIKTILDKTSIDFNIFLRSRFYHILISLIIYILIKYCFHLL